MNERTLTDYQAEIHAINREKGWWEAERNIGETLLLMDTEIAEAFEEYRNGRDLDEIYFKTDAQGNQKPEGIPIELADLFIRLVDFCGGFGIDLEAAVQLKIEYNKTRPYRHGGKRS